MKKVKQTQDQKAADAKMGRAEGRLALHNEREGTRAANVVSKAKGDNTKLFEQVSRFSVAHFTFQHHRLEVLWSAGPWQYVPLTLSLFQQVQASTSVDARHPLIVIPYPHRVTSSSYCHTHPHRATFSSAK
jgi:hypothetical protein